MAEIELQRTEIVEKLWKKNDFRGDRRIMIDEDSYFHVHSWKFCNTL